MKTNTPRFLITHNPSADPSGIYLIHTRYPRFIGRVWQQKNNIDIGWRTIQLPSGELYFWEVVDFIDDDPGHLWEKLMSRTGDWLFNYFKNMNHAEK